ncbi:MAG: hypothetical protein AAFZ63_28440 [Bacteroidota bacterium]
MGGLDQKLPGAWSRFVYYRSLEYLVQQRAGWSYIPISAKLGYQRTILRRRNHNSARKTRLKVNYLPEGQIGSIRIKYLNGNYAGTKMILQYDDQGRIVGREWDDYTKQRFVAQRIFDADGNLVREDIQRQRKDEDLRDFLSVEYHYFTEEELLASLDKEQIIRVEP